jgi:hypothetical protein
VPQSLVKGDGGTSRRAGVPLDAGTTGEGVGESDDQWPAEGSGVTCAAICEWSAQERAGQGVRGRGPDGDVGGGVACVGMRMHPRPRSTPARPRATPTHPLDAEHVWRSRGSLGLGRRHRLRGPRRPTQHRDDLRRAVRAGAGGARAAQPSTAIVAVQQLPVRADLPSITRHGHLQDKGAHGIW